MTLLQMSLSGGLMILAIAGFRLLLQQKVHRNVWIFLWYTAVLRLLIPFSLPAVTSFYNLPIFHAAQTVPQAMPPVESVPAAAVSPSPSVDLITVVWLIGAALILLIVISNHIYQLRRYRFSLPCTAALPTLPKGVTVRMLEGLDAPLTYGIWKPTILLPYHFPTEDQNRLNHVLQHELSHIRNRDILTKLLLIVTAAVHWFNPLVWLMVFLANQDMEMRCDAQAVISSGNERIAYARSLIATEEDRLYSYLQVGFAQSSTERRIRALTKDRAIPVWSIVVSIAVLLLLGAVFMTGQAKASPIEDPPPTPVEEIQEATLEEVSVPQEEVIAIPADEPEELPEPETDEVTEEEAAEEEPLQAEMEEPVSEEVPTESEPVVEEQAAYYPPDPEPEPYIEPPDLDFTLPELPNNNFAETIPSPIPSTNNNYQPDFPVIELYPDPGPQSPLLPPSSPGPQPCMPGISRIPGIW